MGIAAKGRGFAPRDRANGPGVIERDLLHRFAVRQLVGNHQQWRGHTHAIGGTSCELDEGRRRCAVRLVQRNRHAELTIIACHYRQRLAETANQQRIDTGSVLDLRQLRRHVAVSWIEGFVHHDGYAVGFGGDRALVA